MSEGFSPGGSLGDFFKTFPGRGQKWWNLFFPTRNQEINIFCLIFQNSGGTRLLAPLFRRPWRKPGKWNTNNFQAVFKSWKRHHSRSILDQSIHYLITYFHCSVPAKKWKYCHGQNYRNNQHRRENNEKPNLETLFRYFARSISTTIHVINCLWIKRTEY